MLHLPIFPIEINLQDFFLTEISRLNYFLSEQGLIINVCIIDILEI